MTHRLATLEALGSALSLEDALNLYEILIVTTHNAALARQEARRHAGR
ncbi:hypothetical protein IHV25_07240 [Phaeovibrio sulfidiphilus]|uniref:Uncharacterized protein n=1 Tax=Phaeovibrio sulfidiphilus TaxID=1220600 RepID=A0A8J7CWG2_9PROT|nr:hypothetical protein [Phaeovibrio sulfidiphilus]MBE1237441.1 hypothetical protein [Phaeovibrio sulfidiphilus]